MKINLAKYLGAETAPSEFYSEDEIHRFFSLENLKVTLGGSNFLDRHLVRQKCLEEWRRANGLCPCCGWYRHKEEQNG